MRLEYTDEPAFGVQLTDRIDSSSYLLGMMRVVIDISYFLRIHMDIEPAAHSSKGGNAVSQFVLRQSVQPRYRHSRYRILYIDIDRHT